MSISPKWQDAWNRTHSEDGTLIPVLLTGRFIDIPVDTEALMKLAALAPPERSSTSSSSRRAKRSELPIDGQARKYLAAIDPAISGQGGHGVTFRVACALVQGFDMTPDEALPLFREYNERCEPPWDDDDLMHKLQDADKRTGERGYLLSQRDSARPMHISEFETVEFEPLTESAGATGAGDGAETQCDLPTIDSPGDSGDVIPDGWGVIPTLPTVDDDACKEDPESPKPVHKPEPIRNYVESHSHTSGKEKTVKNPMPIEAIVRSILRQPGGFPKRVGGNLFVPRLDGNGVMYLESTDSLFSYLGEVTGFPPQFVNSTQEVQYHTKGEVFQQLKRSAEEFIAVETLPHEPPIKGHYYACKRVRPGNGNRLRELVNFFNPESDVDRDLILAALATLFWGGPYGSRPAFCFTGEGRGSGKTALVNVIADIVGGAVDVSDVSNFPGIVTRLLSPNALPLRILLNDNLKSLKFSSAPTEALITSREISGHQLFKGEGSRPNTLTMFITLNGPSLSKDLAQRTVIVKLRRPEYSGTWTEDVKSFVDAYREEIIADIIGFLRTPVEKLEGVNRWGLWQQAIIARLPEPKEAMAVIREREASVDADHEESELVEDYFAKMLSDVGYDPEREKIFIPTAIACDWFAKAIGERIGTIRASVQLKQKCTESEFRRIFHVRSRKHGRGYEWVGGDAEGDTTRRDLEHQIEISKSNRFI